MTEQIEKQGVISTMASKGTKQESEAGVAGSQSDPEVKREYLRPKTFEGLNYSKISASVGLTKSLGDYEFVRVDCVVEDFCLPDADSRQALWDQISKEAGRRVFQVANDIDKFVREKKNSRAKQQHQGF